MPCSLTKHHNINHKHHRAARPDSTNHSTSPGHKRRRLTSRNQSSRKRRRFASMSPYNPKLHLPRHLHFPKPLRVRRPRRPRFFVPLALAVLTLVSLLPAFPAPDTTATACPDLQVIFARGSGEPLGGSNFTAYQTAMTNAFSLYAPDLSLNYYELGSAPQSGAQYPAVALNNVGVIAGTVSLGENRDFNNSIEQGITELSSFITTTSATCPDTKFILGGYSAGAMVVSKTLVDLPDKSKILSAATVGDPKLYLPEGLVSVIGSTPPACRGKNLSAYRINVPDCTVSAGILGGLTVYASGYGQTVGTWCHTGDPVCGSYPSLKTVVSGDLLAGHTNYTDDTTYPEIADFALKLAKSTFTDRVADSVDTTIRGTSVRDTAIVIDSTGSMYNLFNQYKTEAFKVAKATLDSGGRIALYEFRDEIDESEESYAPRQLCDFSCTYAEFGRQLNSIALHGGGDEPESALSALLHAMNELSWQQGATKSIVLLTDASYHSTDIGGITLTDIVQRSREIDPVNIYVLTNSATSAYYTDLAEQTGGKIFLNTEYSLSTTYLLTRPVASLMLEHYYAYPGEQIYFDASASTSDQPVDHYEWDLDFDGVFEVTSSTPEALKSYDSPISGLIQFKIVDTAGQFSTMTAAVTILDRALATPVINSYALDQSASDLTLSLDTANTSLLAIRLDDQLVGLSTNPASLTFTDLPATSFNLQLTPLSNDGLAGETLEIHVPRATTSASTLFSAPLTPDSAASDPFDYSDSYLPDPLDELLNTPSDYFTGLRAPATGYRPRQT